MAKKEKFYLTEDSGTRPRTSNILYICSHQGPAHGKQGLGRRMGQRGKLKDGVFQGNRNPQMMQQEANQLDVEDLLIVGLFAKLEPESGREVIVELCHEGLQPI